MTLDEKRSADGALGLARKYVTCHELYERESLKVFAKNWICVDHVSNLPVDVSRPIELAGHRLLILGDGIRRRVFRNFCRHRGSLLVNETNCQSIGHRIQCPYHAWTYGRDGKLLTAPNMQDVDEFELESFGLIEIPTELHGGFLWLNFGPQQSTAEFLAPVENQLTSYKVETLQVTTQIEYEVGANWKLIFQNYSECYHCPSVHPALNRLTPYKNSSNDVESGPILGGPMQLSDQSETMSSDGKLVGQYLPGLTEKQRRCVNYFTIFPTMFLSTHPDYVLIHRLERLAVDKTRVVCQFLFHPTVANHSNFDPSNAVEFWDMTNRQDWKVCELAQAGMEDSGYQPGPYSNLESVLAAFDRHYYHQMQR